MENNFWEWGDSILKKNCFNGKTIFLNETIFPQFTALYGINFGDFLLRPQVDYQIDDYLSVRLGMDIFLGSRSGLFGQFGAPARAHRNGYFTGRNDRIFLELKRSFEI